MKVYSYLKVIPPKNKKAEKIDLLTKFAAGVDQAGDNGKVVDNFKIRNSDVAVIQGWTHEFGKEALHLKLRQDIITTQRERNRHVVTADSNLFLYADKTNEPHHYLRYSFDGVFPNTGIYCDTNPDPKRWQQISNDLGIQLGNHKTVGRNIVLCCQRNGGWSMANTGVVEWILSTVREIRKYSNRLIIVRGHPNDRHASSYLNLPEITRLPGVKINIGTTFEEDLSKAWAVVNHNSSSIVGPIIMGYPAFITGPKTSQCAEVAHTDFSKIETPVEFDRQKWLERISMFHWKFSELEDGSCWRHMREYINF